MALRTTLQERCLIYLLDRAEVREHDPAAARLVQDSIGQVVHAKRPQVSRAMKQLCEKGYARTAMIHSREESRRRLAYFMTEKGLAWGRELRRRLERVKVTFVDAEGNESEHALGEIPALLPRSMRFSDLLANAKGGRLDFRALLDWQGRLYGGKVYDVKETVVVPHFSGRTEMLSSLDKFLDDQKLRAFLLVGLPGVGKTALASKWINSLKGRVHVFWRRVHRDMTAGDLCRDLAVMLHSAGRPALSAHLERARDVDRGPPLDLLRQGMSQLRVVLLLDDAHLASKDVADLVKGLMNLDPSTANTKLLLLGREKVGYLTAEDVVLGKVQESELLNLSRTEAEEMLAAMGIKPEHRQQIWERCGGHPLSLELAAGNVMAPENLRRTSATRLTQEVLSKVSADERDALALAAVFNGPVSPDMLGKNATDLLKLCLLRAEGDGLVGVHDLVRVAVLQGVEPNKLCGLHLRAGEFLARSRNPGDTLESLRHFILAEEWDQASGLTEERGQELIDAGLAESLLPVLEQLSWASRGSALAPRIILLQGHALFALARWPEAARVYEKCSSMADAQVAAEALLGQGKVDVQRHSSLALQHLATAQERLDRLGSLRHLAEAQYWIGGSYEDSGRLDEARDAYEHGRAIAFDVGDRRWEGLCTYGIGRVRYLKKDGEGAAREGREALRLLERGGHRLDVAKVGTALGGWLVVNGQINEAEDLTSRAVSEARAIGAVGVLVSGLYNLASVYQRKGDMGVAIPLLEEAMGLHEQLEKYDEAAWCAAWIASEEWMRGNDDRGRTFMSQAERLLSRISEPALRILAFRNFAKASKRAGRKEETRHYLGRAADEARAARLDDLAADLLRELKDFD